MGAEGVEDALRLISSDPWHKRTKLDQTAKLEMVKMAREHGLTLAQIAEQFGVAESTVHYWLSPKRLKKRKQDQKRAQARYRRHQKVIKEHRGPLSEAYSLMRKMLQVIDRENTVELPLEARRALDEAVANLYRAEDELIKAIKLGVKKHT
jgi:transposase-like protein